MPLQSGTRGITQCIEQNLLYNVANYPTKTAPTARQSCGVSYYKNSMKESNKMNREQRRAATKYLANESQKYPEHLIDVPREDWPKSDESRIRVLRSREYLVQVFGEPTTVRLSISRTSLAANGGWRQDIPWEDLQRLKTEAGYGDFDAVEIYPRQGDVVNVANMRHLWVLDKLVPFAWRKDKCPTP